MHAVASKYSGLYSQKNYQRSCFVSREEKKIYDINVLGNSNVSYLSSRSKEAWRSFAQIIGMIVATAFQVPVADISAPTRGCASVAAARQVALYLVHVGFGLTLTQTGTLFGRDRTTVAHACRSVEERREDPDFDACLDYLEIAARIYIDSRANSHPCRGQLI